MRKGLRGLLLGAGVAVLIAVAVGGGVFAAVRVTFDGGTVLVYEAWGNPTADEMAELTGRLTRRLDPDGRHGVIVRAGEASRVEVVVPHSGPAADELVEDVRQKVKQTGVLEFRILANPGDDARAIEEARRLFDVPTAQDRAAHRQVAEDGLPPPAPGGEFEVTLGDTAAPVRYLWVELGKEERESLGLSEQYKGVGKTTTLRTGETYTSDLYDRVAKVRGKTFEWGGSLLFSREFAKRAPSKDEADKKVEYFVLARESPVDSVTVAGDVRLVADVSAGFGDGPAVNFEFVSGGERFVEMTRRNRPTGDLQRQIAILLDGKVVSAPTLRDALPSRGVVSGNFDARSAGRLAAILNAGALNVELKPDPVFEGSMTAADRAAVRATTDGRAAKAAFLPAGVTFAVVLGGWVIAWRVAARRPHAR
jgi:hypothetical protein